MVTLVVAQLWQSGRIRYQRSMVRIQSWAKFYTEHVYW